MCGGEGGGGGGGGIVLTLQPCIHAHLDPQRHLKRGDSVNYNSSMVHKQNNPTCV